MSTLETDLVQAATGTNTALTLKGKGTGVVKLGDGELSFPDSDGSASQVLQTDGSGSLSFTTLSTNEPTSADGQALGSASAEWSDLYLADGGIIYFGDDQDVRLTHKADAGLYLKNTNTSGNSGLGAQLILQTGDTDMASGNSHGQIIFQAPDEGTGTDAILAAAKIDAAAEGDFSSSSNATSLRFFTASSEDVASTSAKMTLSSAGTLNLFDNNLQRANLLDYGEVTNAIGGTGGGTQDIDLTLGNNVVATVDTSTNTFTFSNPTASDELCGFTLFLTNGGSQTVNWPAAVDWAGATAPTLTTSGLDILVFITTDGGTIWHGMVSSADSS